jgi:hypothetical protein
MIFWDYDTEWGAERSRSGSGPKEWGPLEFVNTDRLLDLHAEYGVPACFAVVGAAALPGERPYHDPVQIRRIHEAGHEVASHSFKHDWLPGLSPTELRDTLRKSKEALEQCIGSKVTGFVPPYNQPFDFPQRFAVSLSERRHVRRDRVDVKKLCDALAETGYEFSRLAFKPIHEQLKDKVFGEKDAGVGETFKFRGITCIRLNSPGGFGPDVRAQVRKDQGNGGVRVLYGHPHSISNPASTQHEKELIEIFKILVALKAEGQIQYALPRDFSKGI